MLIYKTRLSRARPFRVQAVRKHLHYLWPVVFSLCSTYGPSITRSAILAHATCGSCAVLQRSPCFIQVMKKSLNSLISKNNKGGRGQHWQSTHCCRKSCSTQSCDKDQNQNNGLNYYAQLKKNHCKFMFQSIEIVTLNKNPCTLHIPLQHSLSGAGNHGSSTSQLNWR